VIRVPARELNWWTASRWLSFAVSATVIAILAALLLDALKHEEERAEKLMVELTWRNMRSGLQLAKGEAMLHGREAEMAGWVGTNPLRWLASEPRGYRGECARPGDTLGAGEWCFDPARRELAYRPRNSQHLRLKQPGAGPKLLRWRVAAAQPGTAGSTEGVRVEYVTAFEWFSE
jgi:hypothetical protein